MTSSGRKVLRPNGPIRNLRVLAGLKVRGGRLTGSLISLPYAIAEAEQNFLSPKREQALIWADLVPQMIVDVTVNRWRHVTPEQVRWVGLHVRSGESLIAAAGLNQHVSAAVLTSYGRFATPSQVERLHDRLSEGDCKAAIAVRPYCRSVLDRGRSEVGRHFARSSIPLKLQTLESQNDSVALNRMQSLALSALQNLL